MTPIGEMTPREIDEAVARKLGYESRQMAKVEWYKDGHFSGWSQLPPYSTSMEAAWEIVEYYPGDDQRGFALMFNEGQWLAGWGECSSHLEISESADTAPLAICRAFLKLDEVKV